ncbi:MAG: DNA polymerase ligase N-terminal domain-containing protein, partial [Myxococcales bacterium]
MATRKKRPAARKAARPATGKRTRSSTSSRTATLRTRKQLEEYERRRDFDVTPEPAPGTARESAAPSFVVHKHDATRLHYDLRLEMEGALASWAVPKGPSYDPSLKRLAVQTEDHPLEYGSFEGRIPDGEYGAGDSLIWDRGTWEPIGPLDTAAQRRKGHLHFRLHGEKLHGEWHLVRTRPAPSGKAQWLLFKGSDEHVDPAYDVVAERPESVVSGKRVTRGPERTAALRRFHPSPEKLLERCFPPMLATLADAPPANESEWLYELKYDGYRALCALSGGRVAMWTRNGLDLTARFPTIARALSKIVVGDAVIDGEIVILDPTGAPRFELIQQGRNDEALLYAFDLLWLDGEDVRKRPLEERRDLLESVIANSPPVLRLSERREGPAAEALADVARRGLEGLIAKRRGSVYEPTRSRSWLKLKALNAQEVA